MALVAVRNKKTGGVEFLAPAVVRIFPDTWELANAPATRGLVESETAPVSSESPRKGKNTKKEATHA